MERYLLSLPPGSRRTDVLHPSEICKPGWCIRESWHLLNGATRPHVPPPLKLASIFAEGHAIHDKWQGWLGDMGVLWGTWITEEGFVYHGVKEGPRDRYLEVPVVDDRYQLQGHADGVVVMGGEHLLLEIKSIGLGTLRSNGFPISGGLSSSFRSISRPFIDHIRQATIYAWILREQGLPIERLLFLYECKEDQSAREFVVKFNVEYIEGVIDRLEQLFPLAEEPPPCTGPEVCACKDY